MESAYGEELDMFRATVQAFFRRDVEPRLRELEKSGSDKRFWQDAARAGLLGVVVPEEYGGPGADWLHGNKGDDSLGNISVLLAEYHGRLHGRMTVLWRLRDPLGRFLPDGDRSCRWPRAGAVLGPSARA